MHRLWDILLDFRYAARTLAGKPLFSAAVIATLALGIGANVAIFNVTDAVLLRLLPVHDANRIVTLRVTPGQPDSASNTGDSETSFSYLVFERLRARQDVFSDLIAHVPLGFNKIPVRHEAEPEEAAADMTSGNLFSGLGVRMECGRPYNLDDELQHASVAVLSDAYFQRSFSGSCQSAIGRTLYIQGVPFTIAGVAQSGFEGLEGTPTDIWIPLQVRPELNAWGSPGSGMYFDRPNWWCLPLTARLAPGVSEARAQALVNPAFLHAAYEPLGGSPRTGERARSLVLRRLQGIPGRQDVAERLRVLMGMVALILVIACGNVAMLLLARNTSRAREFSVRLAIGGTRWRLLRELLAESLLLAAVGAALGCALAAPASQALASWAGMTNSVRPDLSVLLFAAGVSIAAGLIFGIAPAFGATRVSLGLALKNSAANVSQSHSGLRTGKAIVAIQVGLCLTLVAASGLLVRTLWNIENISLGMRASGLAVFGIDPKLAAHTKSEMIQLDRALLDRLRSTPGVESVSLTQNRLGSGWSNNTNAIVDGRGVSGSSSYSHLRWNFIGPGLFATLGVPILEGREFNDQDSDTSPLVAVVNETFANRFFAGGRAIGHQVSFTPLLKFEVVGVVADSKYAGVREDQMPMAYFCYTQSRTSGPMHFEVRTAGDPALFWGAIRKAVSSYSSDLALLQPTTQQAQFDSTISDERLAARLSLGFGALAVLLLVTGLYGTLAYTVTRRTSEIGIRMALGAGRPGVLWMILRGSLGVAVLGLAIGLPLSLGAARLLRSELFGLSPFDPATFAVAIAGILAVSVAAGLAPALRAASIEPTRALRYE